MFKISNNFIGRFKTGDNINHNFRLLSLLYKYFNAANEDGKRLLCKPIIIILVSIAEAVLHDFHVRIKLFTIEGVQSLSDDVTNYIRGKHIDELEKYIASAKKHDFFDMKDSKFYDYLSSLRTLRNRIHIQNIHNNLEPDEFQAFTEKRKIWAEMVVEKILKTMNERHPRKIDVANYVDEFELPWSNHFSNANQEVQKITVCPYCANPAYPNYDTNRGDLCFNCGEPY